MEQSFLDRILLSCTLKISFCRNRRLNLQIHITLSCRLFFINTPPFTFKSISMVFIIYSTFRATTIDNAYPSARAQAWVCGRSLDGLWIFCLLWVLCVNQRDVCCVGLITYPEESYRFWCDWVWLWSLDNGEVLAKYVLLRHGIKWQRGV